MQLLIEKVVTVRYAEYPGDTPKPLPRRVLIACTALSKGGEHVEAIKYARTCLGLGLKEAKDLCDALRESTDQLA